MTSRQVVEQNRLIYQDLYQDPLADGSYEVRNKTRLVRQLARYLPRMPQTVLDIGFGTGRNLQLFAAHATLIVGIEPISSPVTSFQAVYSGSNFQGMIADAQALPFQDSCFDLVIMSHVLEHLPDDVGALRGIQRVLRPGGHAMLLVPCRDLEPNPLHIRQYEPDTLRALCEQQGLAPRVQVVAGSSALQALLLLLLKLANLHGSPDAAQRPYNRQSALRRLYQSFAVPCLLAWSRVDDRLASFRRLPLETALLVRRDTPYRSEASANA